MHALPRRCLFWLLLVSAIAPLENLRADSWVIQTFAEEVVAYESVVVAELIELPEDRKKDEAPPTKFRLVESIKGKDAIGLTFEAPYAGEEPLGSRFIVMRSAEGGWSYPLPASERVQEYFRQLPTAPAAGPERIAYFLNYLEDQEAALAADAVLEISNAEYSDLRKVKDKLNHDRLVEWIKNSDDKHLGRRRLYLQLLGICADKNDLPFLEQIIQSPKKKPRMPLNEVLACYLTLRGDDGVALLEDTYLKNSDAKYADTYSAIMALRFHAAETDRVSRKRTIEALRLMLERPDLADLVIPDLQRLQDWESAPKLMELYRTGAAGNNWVRVPVVIFLRACPERLKMADYLEECERLDSAAVKRAKAFGPAGE